MKSIKNTFSSETVPRDESVNSEDRFVAVIDQGTSSSRVVLFPLSEGGFCFQHHVAVTREHPQSGWVEQCPQEIYHSTLICLNEVAKKMTSVGIPLKNLLVVGIANQRETTIAWDRLTGKALTPAIVWCDSRTAGLVKRFIGLTFCQNKNAFQEKTGLPIHSYFSALKICWMLENIPEVAEANAAGRLMFGTVDSWLIWCLTGASKGGLHLTDVTNASRTLLFNIHEGAWDRDICSFMGIPEAALPRVISSAEVYGSISDENCLLKGTHLGGILGDQQAALVGHTWESGDLPLDHSTEVKVTFGTGAFLLWCVGEKPLFSKHGILTTIAHQMGRDAPLVYALEGAIAYSGATVDWLRDRLRVFSPSDDLDMLAEASKGLPSLSRDRCYLVPAFTGLFCPHWREDARGLIVGFDEDCSRCDLVAAALRASAYQTQEVLEAATDAFADTRPIPGLIAVDGGLANSRFLLQSLADITGATVHRPNRASQITALGGAFAAALAVGENVRGLLSLRRHSQSDLSQHLFTPAVDAATRSSWLAGWKDAVQRSLAWSHTPTNQ